MTHNHGVVGSSPTGSTIRVNNLINNFNTFTIMITRIFIFTSSRKSDKVSGIRVSTTTVERAYMLINKHFNKHGYKGVPVLAV